MYSMYLFISCQVVEERNEILFDVLWLNHRGKLLSNTERERERERERENEKV